ncbi:MAG: glycerol-3-phosphate dehydrogenase/oxidase [Planctomycetes bacterium]|nr:glycerol-3-phosphate dehydrogenase/oxidase [Planctomycetota bacterium]
MGTRLGNLDREFDVLVVGGGAFGCGVAREAALNGLSVALVERDDLAGATSSASSKMIHGGLRYLEHLEFGLVRQALRERAVLEDLAPGLVHPCPFLAPVYRDASRGMLKLRMGLWLYDLLARPTRAHRRSIHGAQALHGMEPALAQDGLRGGGRFWDWCTYDSRLVAEVGAWASENGAVVMTRAEAGPPRGSAGRFEVDVTDRLEGDVATVRAKSVIAAVGPWSDSYRMASDPNTKARARLTSGIHLIVPKVMNEHAIIANARSDGRVFFLLPFFDRTLIGTTDRDVTGDPRTLTIEDRDVDYLIEEANAVLSDRPLAREDVISSFIGIRTLASDATANPSNTSREQQIWEEPEGVIHIVGGKLTTWRLIARELLEKAAASADLSLDDGTRSRTTPIITGDLYLPDRMPDDTSSLIDLARRTHALTAEDLLRRRTPIMLTDPPTDGVIRMLNEELAEVRAEPG